MSVLEMKVPSPGESITEVEIATWLVKDGDYVEKDQPIAEVDSDKATLELPAEQSGGCCRAVSRPRNRRGNNRAAPTARRKIARFRNVRQRLYHAGDVFAAEAPEQSGDDDVA